MTRRESLVKLLAAPRDHADQSRIGRRIVYATPDGREKINYVFRVLATVQRAARKAS